MAAATTRPKLPVRTQVSAGGVAFRREGDAAEVVLVRVRDRWQLPKGLVDAGESPEAAAIRETREEGGVETELVAPLEVVEYWYVGDARGEGRVRFHKFVHFFLLEVTGGDPSRHDREVDEARWVDAAGAEGMLAFRSERAVMAQARALLVSA